MLVASCRGSFGRSGARPGCRVRGGRRGEKVSQDGRERPARNVVLVVFRLGEVRYALYLEAVERVLPAAEATPLPGAPEIVAGALDVAGKVLPVLDIRRRFGHRAKAIEVDDHLILARTASRAVILPVDAVTGVVQVEAGKITAAEGVVPGLEYVEGLARLPDGLVLIHDLDRFLSLDERRAVDGLEGLSR
ncbi:MAG: chemotaxis protein CheW [Deltaproteobacteria bacterium]|nr:chemotaxis protein CheW [Deltaproteobacteria bacterium]